LTAQTFEGFFWHAIDGTWETESRLNVGPYTEQGPLWALEGCIP